MASVKKNEPLSRHTTFRIGGTASLYMEPENEKELADFVGAHRDAYILGGGSNLLVSDRGIEKVISMKKIRGVRLENRPDGTALVTAMAGESFTGLARKLYRLSLSGLEYAFGIPGTLGGAVIMNAGAGGGEVRDSLVSVRILRDGMFEELDADKLGLGYRSSDLPESSVVVSAVFEAVRGDKNAISEKMKKGLSTRKATQPLKMPSAGSVFKNPPGKFAGKVIDDLGFKGLRVGDAMVSEMHANFIVNLGRATAGQVLELMEKIEREVLQRTGIRLEREIKLAGSF